MRILKLGTATSAILVFLVFLLARGAHGEDAPGNASGQIAPEVEVPVPLHSRQPEYLPLVPLPPPAHRFWDRTNLELFAGVAVMRTLDYTSTRNMLRRGREEILLPDDVVNNHAGFAALEAASTATSVGISYLLHRTGHHKLERWLSIGHISVAGFGASWNYSLKTKHPAR